MSQAIRSAAILAERHMREAIRYASGHVEVAVQDVVEVLGELDRTRVRLEQAQAAAVAALEMPKVGQAVTPAPLTQGACRG
jgi:hypothetical protein